MSKTLDFLKELALEITDVEESVLSGDMTFEDVGFDSLAFVEVQLSIFQKFGVRIQPDSFASGELKTLDDLAAHIDERMAEATAAE